MVDKDLDFAAQLDALDEPEEAPATVLPQHAPPMDFALPGSTRKLIDDAVGARETERARKDNADKGASFLEGLTDPQQYVEGIKGIVPGAIQFGGTIVASPDTIAARGQQGAAKFGRNQLDVMNRIDRGEYVSPMDDATGYLEMTPEQRIKARTEQEEATQAFNPTRVQDRPFYKAGETIQKYGKDFMPAAPGYEDAYGRKIGEGLGSLVAGLPFAYFGTVPAAVAFGGAGIGEATQRAVEFDRKERAAGRAGLSEDQITLAGMLGIGPGATDLLPIEVFMGRLPLPLPPALRAPIARGIGRIGGQAFIEGVQEGGQNFLQNLIAREIYNPDQKLMDGVQEGSEVGAGVGGIAQTAKEIGMWLIKSGAVRRTKGVHDSLAHPKPASPSGEQATPPEDTRTLAPSQEGPTPRLKAGEGSVRGPVDSEPAIQDAERLLSEIEGGTIAQPSKPEDDDGTAGAPAIPSPPPTRNEGGAAAPVPTFNDILAVLPPDTNGDPDLAPLFEALQGRPYGQLAPEEKVALLQQLKGETPAAPKEAAQAAKPAPTTPEGWIEFATAKSQEYADVARRMSMGEMTREEAEAAVAAAKRDWQAIDRARTKGVIEADETRGRPHSGAVETAYNNLRTELDVASQSRRGFKPSPAAPAAAPEAVSAPEAPTVAPETAAAPAAPQQGVFTEAGGQTSLVPPVTLRERLETLAAKPLRGGNAPADQGLFGSGSQQLDLVDMARESARADVRRQPKPVSIVDFLRSRGGINSEGGDVRAMDGLRRPGLINNRSGLSLDDARELAVEAGYLREADTTDPLQTSTADLLELIRSDLAGERVYSDADSDRVADQRATQDTVAAQERLAAYADEMAAWSEANGVPFDLSQSEIERAAVLMIEGTEVGTAIERVIIESYNEDISNALDSARALGESAASALAGDSSSIPFGEDATGVAGEGVRRDGGESADGRIGDAERTRFSEVIASKERRSNWAKAAGLTEKQLQALTAEAVADGRLTLRKGQPVRTGKAKASPSPQVEVARAATSVPMGRAAEVRLEKISSDVAYKHAAAILGAGRDRAAAIKKLSADKKATRAVLDEIHLAVTGKASKSLRTKGAVIEALGKVEEAAPETPTVSENETVATEQSAETAQSPAPPGDSYAIRTLQSINDPVVKGHYEALARSGTAVEPALGAIASDRRLDAVERQQLAELYVGEPVSGDPVEAIRSAAERRGNDLTSALLHGFSPEVSPSNLRVRDFDAQMLETAFQRLAERLPSDAILAVRSALRMDLGDEIAALEGAYLTSQAARVEFGINAGAAKKVIAVSLEYGPDTAMRTFTHEEVHLLRQSGIVKGKDWETLAGIAKRRPKKAEATRILDGLIASGKISQESYDALAPKAGKLTYRELYEVDARYGDYLKGNENLLIEETVAHAAADWADGRQFAAPIERVFMRIRDFLEAIQNALNGLGFRSANDIFESIWAGEFVRKFEEAEAKRAEAEASARARMAEEDVIALASDGKVMAAFAGERATTADLNALNAAKEMDAAGEDRTDIWKQTGWFKGVDGRWRFEIDDSKSKLRAFGPDFSLLQVELTHEELFKAYPQMAEVEFNRVGAADFEGMFTPGGILPSTISISKDAKARRSTVLHESQHALQDIEGFAEGGSADPGEMTSAYNRISSAVNNIIDAAGGNLRYATPEQIAEVERLRAEQKKIPFTSDRKSDAVKFYKRLAGEVESRTVQARLSLTPEQRANRAPWLDYDVPESQQIVRMPEEGGEPRLMASIQSWLPTRWQNPEKVARDYREIATTKPTEVIDGIEVRRKAASKNGGINYRLFQNGEQIGELMIDAPRRLPLDKSSELDAWAEGYDKVERRQPVAGTVTRIEIAEGLRGKGMGSRLLDIAEADLKEAGAILHPGDTSMTQDFINLYAKRDPAILRDAFDRAGITKRDDPSLMLDRALRERERRGQPMLALRDWMPSRNPTPPQATEQGDSPGLNKIISDLKTSLGMTVNQGLWGTTLRQGKRTMRIRPPSNMTGQYDRETGNISIRQSRDIKTLAHEGGHLLETLLGNELATLKAQYVQELTGRPVASGSEISEGFADWFRSYVLDRAAAEKQAPNFAREFDDLLEAERPDLLIGLQEVSDQYQTYVKSAPLDQVTADMVTDYESGFVKEIMEHPNGVPDAVMNSVSGWLSTSYSGLVDALHPIQMAVRKLLDIAERNGMVDADGKPLSIKDAEDPYKIIRMFAGAYNRGRVWLERGVSDLATGQIIGPSLKDALEKALGGQTWSKKRFKQFNAYLVALRAVEEYNALENRDLTIAKHDSLLQRMGDARTTLSAKAQQEQATLARREDDLTRAQTTLRDRRRELRRVETRLTTTQERLDDLRADLAEAGADNGSLRRRVQMVERDQQRLLREAESLVDEVAELDIEIGILEPEIEQRRDGLQRYRDQRTQLDVMEANVQREQKYAEARPKKPPTLEPKETHERIIKELGTPEFQEAARLVHEFAFSLLTVQHQAGFWTDEAFAELSKRKDWYVPFQRDMSDVEGAAAQYRGSMGWTSPKKYKGSDRAIITPMAILSQDAYRTAQRIAFNNFVKALVQLSERVGPGGGAIAERLEREIGQLDPSQQNFDRLVEVGIRAGLNPIDAQMLAQRAELNLSSKDIIKVLVSPENLGPGEKASLPMWEKGERITVRLPDAQLGYDMANAINAIGMDNQDLWTSIFGKAANMLRVGVTTSFDFIGANIFRDMWAAWKVTGAAPVLTHIRGARIMLGKGDVAGIPAEQFQRQYNEIGGIAGGININAQSATQQRDVRDLLGTEIKFKSVVGGTIVGGAFGAGLVGALGGAAGLLLGGPVGGLVGLAAAKTTGFAVGGAIGGYMGRHGEVFKLVESAETAARLGVAAHAYKRAIAYDPSLSQSEAIFQAGFDTRDYLDWNRRGSKTFAVARAIPFWLSAVNGLTKTLQQGVAWGPRGSGVARQVGRTDTGKALKGVLERRLGIVWKHQTGDILSNDEQVELAESYKSYARWAGLTMITMMMILAGMSSMGDDEDDVRDEAKFRERYIRINGVDVRLPGVFELDMPAIASRIIYDAYTGGDDRYVRRLSRAAFELVAPPMGITAIDALTGVAFNSRIGGRPIVGPYLASKPPQDQFDAYTSQVSMDFSKAIADTGVPQWMIPPPKKLDHLLTTLGGSWGRDTMGFYEDAKRAAGLNEGPAKKATDIPVVRRFTTDSARLSRSVAEFWEMTSSAGGEMTRAAAGYKERIEGERPVDADIWLSRLDKEQKVWALTEYYGSPSDKREHPLKRLDASMDAIRSVQEDIIRDTLAPKERQGRRRVRDFDSEIKLTPEKKREIVDILTRAKQIEARNTMILMERPGFKHMQIKDPKLIWDELKASSPLVYEHMQDVQQNKKIEDWPSVQREWPRYRDRVLKQGVNAF